MAEFIPQPNTEGNTATYTDATLNDIERAIGSEVQLAVLPIEDPEYKTDEHGNVVVDEEGKPVEAKPGLYAGAVMRYPSREAIERYLTLNERFPVQALDVLMRDMCVPGHYDAEVFSDTKVFMGMGAAAQEISKYRRAALKKRVRSGA